MTNRLMDQLIRLGISTKDSFKLYSNRVRDLDNLKVFKCEKSQVIVLDYDHRNVAVQYETKQGLDYWQKSGINSTSENHLNKLNITDDDDRRAKLLRPLVKNKNLLDFGTGMGGPLRLLQQVALQVHGVELQSFPREYLNNLNIPCYKYVSETAQSNYDCITLFHVLEHLDNPQETLMQLKAKLKPGGTIIVEVPHARDALLSFYQSEDFKNFTLWSEHLILHTRESLRLTLEESGLKIKSIQGIQRYPVANHLYWLSNKKPGGQNIWHFLNSKNLHKEYESKLAQLDITDTLLAFCELA